jgi:hypothetical protein
VTDSLTVPLDRAILFHTRGGEPVPAHGVSLVLTGDGATTPPGARVVFRVTAAAYERAAALFGVTGEPPVPFERDQDVEIEARLRTAIAAGLIARGGGARELADALVDDGSPAAFIALAECWQAVSVVQQIEPPAGVAGSIQSGFRVDPPGGSSLVDVARRAAPLDDLGDGLYGCPALQLLVWIDEPARMCAVYSVAGDPVPAERRGDVAQFLVDRNYYLNVGAFEMDVDDGEVRLRTSIDATAAAFDEALFANLVAANLHVFALHQATLRELTAGELTLAQARERHAS